MTRATHRRISWKGRLLGTAAGCGLLVALADARGQSPLTRLESMQLRTASVGSVAVHFAVDDRRRAMELATLVERAATFVNDQLGTSFDVRIAALGPRHWYSEFPDGPYTIPWCDIPGRIIFVPASGERLPKGGVSRAIDFITLHEYGHLVAKRYFHPDSARDYGPVRWFEEFLATYIAYAFVRSVYPEWADGLALEWNAQTTAFTPRVLSLDWRFMNDLVPDEFGPTYAWYQNVLNLRAVDVHRQHGIGLLRDLRRELPWRELDAWTVSSVIADLESVAPGFAAWARRLERRKPDEMRP